MCVCVCISGFISQLGLSAIVVCLGKNLMPIFGEYCSIFFMGEAQLAKAVFPVKTKKKKGHVYMCSYLQYVL